MKWNLVSVFAVSTACLWAGSTSYESSAEVHMARDFVTDDLQNQVMNNLIRAKNGLAFAHYDLGKITSQIGAKFDPNVTSGRSISRSTYPVASETDVDSHGIVTAVKKTAGSVSSAIEQVQRPFSYGLTSERSNLMTIDSSPVFDDPKVYAAYVRFLNYPKKTKMTDVLVKNSNGTERYVRAETYSDNKKDFDAVQSKLNNEPKAAKETQTVTTTEYPGAIVPFAPTKTWVEQTTQPEGDKPASLDIKFGEINALEGPCPKPPKDKSDYLPRTLRHWDDGWYWVPTEYKPEFSKLCVALVARGGSSSGDSASAAASANKKIKATLDRTETNQMALPFNVPSLR